MPAQSLTHFDGKSRTRDGSGRSISVTSFARAIMFGGALALTAYGASEMWGVINVGPIKIGRAHV